MITFIYYLIHIALLLITIKVSNNISKCSDNEYWKKCIPIIIFYSIEEGMRWGRDVDWTLYYGVFEGFQNGYDTNFEFLFKLLFKTFAISGLSYSTFIIFCSFMWILSLCYFIKPYRKQIKFFLPICLLYFTIMASNTFRWYLAMSFFLIAFRNIIDGRLSIGIAFLICTLGTHTAAFLMSMIGVICVYTLKNALILRPVFVVIISLALILLFSIESLQNYVIFFKYFNTERFDNYFNNAQQWFYSETNEGERKNIIEYILLMTPFYIVLFSAYKLQLQKMIPDGILFYNLLTIWIILRSITSGIELLQRMSMYYEFIFALMVSFVMVLKNKITNLNRQLLIVVVLFIIYKGYIGYFKPYGNEELMKYIWNSELVSPEQARTIYKLQQTR